jgi:hypothetical protein
MGSSKYVHVESAERLYHGRVMDGTYRLIPGARIGMNIALLGE